MANQLGIIINLANSSYLLNVRRQIKNYCIDSKQTLPVERRKQKNIAYIYYPLDKNSKLYITNFGNEFYISNIHDKVDLDNNCH